MTDGDDEVWRIAILSSQLGLMCVIFSKLTLIVMLSAVNLVANEFYFFARDAKKGVLACHAFIHARKAVKVCP